MKMTHTLITGDKVTTVEGGDLRAVNFILTGNYATDEARHNQIRGLVEKFGGDFYFEYPHKCNLYRFEIGGEFPTVKQGDQFIAAVRRLWKTWEKSKKPMAATA